MEQEKNGRGIVEDNGKRLSASITDDQIPQSRLSLPVGLEEDFLLLKMSRYLLNVTLVYYAETVTLNCRQNEENYG